MEDDRGGYPPRLFIVLAVTLVAALLALFIAVFFERGFGFVLLIVGIAAGSVLGYWATAGWSNRSDDDEPPRL